jgi:hypothetical protein
MFSGKWKLEEDKDGAFFIDRQYFVCTSILLNFRRDGTHFRYILNYLRTGKLIVSTDTTVVAELIEESIFYSMPDLMEELENMKEEEEETEEESTLFANSSLLSEENQQVLNQWYGKPTQKWRLLYKGSRDNFKASTFHARCDHKGETFTIIRSSNNFLFGGYSSQPWTSKGDWKKDNQAFIFTLTNPHSLPPTRYNAVRGKNTIRDEPNLGPSFGGGTDILLKDNSNQNSSSYTNFSGSDFYDTTGKLNLILWVPLKFMQVKALQRLLEQNISKCPK